MLRIEKKPNISLYTTGACAVAAVKGAADMLINEREREEVIVTLPACVRVRFKLLDVALSSTAARCAVAKKWSGIDGIDDTMLIYAKATKTKKARDIVINYKKGIGRYAKKVGAYRKGDAAVTPEVKFLMKNAILDLWEGKKIGYGLLIEVACPKGVEIGKKTVNEAYGIVGGIGLIGSYGVSVKDDYQSRLDKVTLSMKRARLGGATKLIFSETNHAEILESHGIMLDNDKCIAYKSYLAEVSELAERVDVDGLLFVNNLAAALPLTGGIGNTELNIQTSILAAHAARFGVDTETINRLLECIDMDSAYRIVEESGVGEKIMGSVIDMIKKRLEERFPTAETEVMIFTRKKGIIAQSEGAMDLLQRINAFELSEVDFGAISIQEGEYEANFIEEGANQI